MLKFTANKENINRFMQMANLLSILDDSEIGKDAKVAEIKAAKENGLINLDEALELAMEFC